MAISNRNRLLEKYVQVVRMDGLNTNKNVNVGINGSTPSLSVAGSFVANAGATSVTAGGATTGIVLGGAATAPGIYAGSGAPTISAAQGSLYLRTDGSSSSTRMYVNSNGSTTWVAVTTAS